MENAQRHALIIGRVGDASLHESWISGASSTMRNFDLHLSYYGQAAAPFRDRPHDVTLSHDPGAKFPGLSACLDKLEDRLPSYRWICFVDDDIAATGETWNTFFDVLDQIQPILAQPALTHQSFYSHDITLQRPNYMARWTNFVEIMNFCFRQDFFQAMRPSFLLNESGWGIDYYWAEHATPKERSIAIVDAAPVSHTKAVGRGGLYDVLEGGNAGAHKDRRALTKEKPTPVVYAGITKDGSLVSDPSLNAPLQLPRQIKKLRKLLNIVRIKPS